MEKNMYPQVFAAINTNENIRGKSRSGGVFTAVSDVILKQDGTVYGVILKDCVRAEHIRAIDHSGRDSMRGSKYIQSSTMNTYREVREDLRKGKKVLYTGTSCQIAGLKGYLRNEKQDNLYCMDIICHGVPSPLVWESYVRYLEKKLNGDCLDVDFRNKEVFGWKAHYESLQFRTRIGKREKKYYSDVFKDLFYSHYILRPSCYKCPYKSIIHPGDMTIGDYWGIRKAAPELDDDKGVSLVLVNNAKGEELFTCIKDSVKYKSTLIEDSMQPPLIAPFEEPEERDMFWRDYYSMPFDKLLNKYSNHKGIYSFINSMRIMKKIVM